MCSVNIMVPGAQTPKCHFVKVNNNSILIINNYFKIVFLKSTKTYEIIYIDYINQYEVLFSVISLVF